MQLSYDIRSIGFQKALQKCVSDTVNYLQWSFLQKYLTDNPANIYFFKAKNRNTKKRREICSQLTIKTPKRRQLRGSGVFIVNCEHISHLFCASIADFEQLHASWETPLAIFTEKLHHRCMAGS